RASSRMRSVVGCNFVPVLHTLQVVDQSLAMSLLKLDVVFDQFLGVMAEPRRDLHPHGTDLVDDGVTQILVRHGFLRRQFEHADELQRMRRVSLRTAESGEPEFLEFEPWTSEACRTADQSTAATQECSSSS